MSLIRKMRAQLQAPRLSVDTWYGRQVMRRFSIYLTWAFCRLNCSPNTVTLISLIFAAAGCLSLHGKAIGLGILFLNFWYLFDHVDGEVARFTKKTSVTGFYFDTIINFLVQPFAFLTLGSALSNDIDPRFFIFGLMGSYGYLMLSILSMCEDSIVLHLTRTGKMKNPNISQQKTDKPRHMFRDIFSFWHNLITFPYFLLVLTVTFGIEKLMFISSHSFIKVVLIFYSLSTTFIWVAQLSQTVASKKLDKRYFTDGRNILNDQHKKFNS